MNNDFNIYLSSTSNVMQAKRVKHLVRQKMNFRWKIGGTVSMVFLAKNIYKTFAAKHNKSKQEEAKQTSSII